MKRNRYRRARETIRNVVNDVQEDWEQIKAKARKASNKVKNATSTAYKDLKHSLN
ncbi:hypothetical protein HY844_01465 [Candidatus Berkelbacteria bacterium]|nr:hypothetical protein [Candidatus Berkelbacteria bacterium]